MVVHRRPVRVDVGAPSAGELTACELGRTEARLPLTLEKRRHPVLLTDRKSLSVHEITMNRRPMHTLMSFLPATVALLSPLACSDGSTEGAGAPAGGSEPATETAVSTDAESPASPAEPTPTPAPSASDDTTSTGSETSDTAADEPTPASPALPSSEAESEAASLPPPTDVPDETSSSCDGIVAAGFELCDSGADFCAAVFPSGEGCSAVCAAAGLNCVEAWENVDGQCAADMGLGAIPCEAGHQSDYCVCGSGEAPPENVTPEPDQPTTPPAAQQPTAPEPEPKPDPEPEQPNVGPRQCECDPAAGEADNQVSNTIVVESGQTYDGQCLIYRANPSTLGNGSQDEGQSPVFRVNNGGTLRNVVLGASAADGIHIHGSATLENVHWLDIGEDAMTIKEPGTVSLDCGSAVDGEDKVFQVNAETEFHISNFTARNAGKFLRQNGGTGFNIDVFIDHCDISEMDEVIFRTDSTTSHVTLTNTRYSRIGNGLFMFGSNVITGNSAQSSVSNNQQY